MKVVAIALVLLQASLHSCRTYNTATPKNDTETSKPVKLPSKLIQILESLDSPDAKITKIKELIPVYDELPEFRVKSNKKHLFMPYKKKGKPLAYILKKTYVNEIVSEHTDESFDTFEDVKNNERMYKEKPTSHRNKVNFPSSQNEKSPETHRNYEYPKINEIDIVVDGDVTDEPKINEYDQYNKNKTQIKKSAEVIDDLKEPIIVIPAKHKHVYHTHRHGIENSEEKTELVSNSEKVSDVLTEAKHEESNHHHHGRNPIDLQLFPSEIKSDNTDSNREQIPHHQKIREDKPIDFIPKADKIEKELDQIQGTNLHKHHHHPEADVSIVAVANTDDTHLLNIVTTKHGHHKINLGEENLNPSHDLIHHIIAHHTEDPHDLVNIDAHELHSDKIDADSDLNNQQNKSNLELVVKTNATEQKSGEKEHPHPHSHSTHHHSVKESVKDLDEYLSYLNDLDLVSPKTSIENYLNLSNDTVIEVILNDTSPFSTENNDNDAADFNRVLPGREKLMNNQVALNYRKLDSHTSDFSTSEYYSDEFGSDKSGDASGSFEPSSEFIDSVSESSQESTETDENSSTASSESENNSVYSNELVTNDSNYSYSESNSEFDSKSLEFDSLPSSQSDSVSESNESDISGLEELPSEDSNLISESVELSSESDLTNLSDESKQLDDTSVSFESQSFELSNSGSIRSSEIGSNYISGSDNSESDSEKDSKSDFSSSSGSGYLSLSESEESSQIDLAGENVSVSKESIIESSENQLNSTVILAPTIHNESNLISGAFDLNSKESFSESTPTDIDLTLEVSYSSLDANTTGSGSSVSNLEPSPSNLETLFTSESYPPHVESNASSIENSALLETTVLNTSSVASEESTNSSLVNASIVETPVSDLDPTVSSLMSSASSLKSVASNLESSVLSVLSLESVPGLESIASKLNTTASDLVYVALNLESTAMSLKWSSGLSTAVNLMASSTESIVRSELSAESGVILASDSESKTSNHESTPSFESISQIIEKSPSSEAFYSTIQSSINNNGHRAVKKDLCKDRPVIENKLSNGKKTYSMSFVFNK